MWLCWRTRALSTAPSGSRSASNAVRPCLTVRLGLCRGPPNPPALVFATPNLPGPTESPISDTPWPNSDLSVDTTLYSLHCRGEASSPLVLHPLSLHVFLVEVSAHIGFLETRSHAFSPMARPQFYTLPLRKPSIYPPVETQPPVLSLHFPCGYLFRQTSQTLFCFPVCLWQDLLHPMAPSSSCLPTVNNTVLPISGLLSLG